MFKKALLALSLTVGVSSAFANSPQNRHVSVNLSEGQTSSLGFCGGTASAFRVHGTLELQISGAHNCSNIFKNGQEVGKLENGRGSETFGLSEQVGQNTFRFVAKSGTGDTSATIFVSSYRRPVVRVPEISPRTPADFTLSSSKYGMWSANLDTCGGTASIRLIGNDVYLYLQGMSRCSMYDVLSADGMAINFPKTPITGPIRLGRNNSGEVLKMVVRSERGNVTGNYDVFRVILN